MSAKWFLGTALVGVAAAGVAVAVTLAVTNQSSKPTNEQISLDVYTNALAATGGEASWTVNGTVLGTNQDFYGSDDVYRALVPVGTTAQVTMTNYVGLGWCGIFINPRSDNVVAHYVLKVSREVHGRGTVTCTW